MDRAGRIGIAAMAVALVGGAAWLTAQQGGLEAPPPDAVVHKAVAHRCHSLAGPQADRVAACMEELAGPVALSADAEALVKDLLGSGKLLYVGGTPAGDGRDAVTPEQLVTLLGTDEAEAARTLRDAGYRGVMVQRDLVGAVDRDAAVLARLAHHDHLEFFELRRVTDTGWIYTVRKSSATISSDTGEALLRGLRERLARESATPQPWTPSGVRLLGVMRLQGRTLLIRHASGSDVERVLDELAGELRTRWERDVEVLGVGSLDERLGDVRLEVHVVMERAEVEPRDRDSIADIFEMGVDGLMFRHKEGVENQKFCYAPGSELVTHSYRSVDELFRETVRDGGWYDIRPWEDASTRLDLIRTQHFMDARPGGGGVVRLYRGLPEEPLEAVTDDALVEMLVDGAEWWTRNTDESGFELYKYWPAQNRSSTDYNEVRHLLGPRDLAVAYRYRPDPRYLDTARRQMDWMLRYAVYPEDPPSLLPSPPADTMLFRYKDNQKLGTVAVALLAWVAWAETTGSHAEDDRIRKMARFVLARAEDNGKFDPYFVPPGHPYYGQKNDIVPGEAALALGEVADYFDDLSWVAFYPKFLDYYEPWWNERAPNTTAYGRWPHDTYDNQTRLDLVQFGPWSVMAARQYFELTGDERAAEFGLQVADWMIDHYEWTGERSPFPDYVGGYYKIPTEIPAMQSFCYSEGTAAAYHLAVLYAPERKGKYELATRETLRFLRVMQFDDVDSYFVARPELVHGGIKYALNENKIRIDYEGHGLSTIAQYLEARALDPDVRLRVTPLPVPPGGAPFRALTAEALPIPEGAGGEEGEEGGD